MNSHDYIKKYFEGSLTPEEQLEFDKLLETDSTLAESFAFEKQLKKAITLNERSDLKKKLQSFESESPKKNSFQIYYIAASIALFFGLGYYFLNSSTSGLYQDYYQTYPNVIAPTVRGESHDDLKSKAFYEYDSGNYETSSKLFSDIYEKDGSDYALFYKAISLMELKRYENAIAVFNEFDTTKNNEFAPFVKWYKALSYLKIGDKNNCISILKTLSTSDNPQQERAKKLLHELE